MTQNKSGQTTASAMIVPEFTEDELWAELPGLETTDVDGVPNNAEWPGRVGIGVKCGAIPTLGHPVIQAGAGELQAWDMV